MNQGKEGGLKERTCHGRTNGEEREEYIEVRGEKHDITCLQKCLSNVATSPTFVLEYITRASGSG